MKLTISIISSSISHCWFPSLVIWSLVNRDNYWMGLTLWKESARWVLILGFIWIKDLWRDLRSKRKIQRKSYENNKVKMLNLSNVISYLFFPLINSSTNPWSKYSLRRCSDHGFMTGSSEGFTSLIILTQISGFVSHFAQLMNCIYRLRLMTFIISVLDQV